MSHQNKWFNTNSTKYLLKQIHEQTFQYETFASGNLIVIDKHSSKGALDSKAVDFISYRQCITKLDNFPVVKIEGFEKNKILQTAIKPLLNSVKDVHVFKTNKTGFSFKWHKDDVNVKLLVLTGKKIVNIRNSKYTLLPGQFVDIPKGHIHRVFSTAGTIALSIGLK